MFIKNNKIKEVRKSKGISQKDLAKKIGVSPSAMSQFEKQTNIKEETLKKIATALDVSPFDLFDDIDLTGLDNRTILDDVIEIHDYNLDPGAGVSIEKVCEDLKLDYYTVFVLIALKIIPGSLATVENKIEYFIPPAAYNDFLNSYHDFDSTVKIINDLRDMNSSEIEDVCKFINTFIKK